jgi:ribosomal protein S18 acetylase RimI-like enzyme
MAAHAMDHARAQGFRAMQFNFVVASNARAIRLWQRMEFVTVGRLYDAFAHPQLGPTDALVMQRDL